MEFLSVNERKEHASGTDDFNAGDDIQAVRAPLAPTPILYAFNGLVIVMGYYILADEQP